MSQDSFLPGENARYPRRLIQTWRRVPLWQVCVWAIGSAIALIWILPFVWMVSTSFKPPGDVMTRTVEWIPRRVTLDNYIVVFERPIIRWFINSMIVTTTVTVLSLIGGAMAGYAIARLHWPGRKLFFVAILMSLMIPTEATIVPLFIGFLRVGLMDSYPALILPSLASVFCVYLFRQFFIGLPYEIEEAAIIDGASRFSIFWLIGLPLARATTIAAAVLIFTTEWNAFVWPLLITFSEQMKVLPIGMAVYAPAAGGRTQIEGFAPAMAAMTLLGLPSLIVFLVLQRYFMEGVITTGIKG